MLSSGKLAPAFKVYLKMRENTRSNIRYYANRMTSLLLSELPFQTKFPCENSRGERVVLELGLGSGFIDNRPTVL